MVILWYVFVWCTFVNDQPLHYHYNYTCYPHILQVYCYIHIHKKRICNIIFVILRLQSARDNYLTKFFIVSKFCYSKDMESQVGLRFRVYI